MKQSVLDLQGQLGVVGIRPPFTGGTPLRVAPGSK